MAAGPGLADARGRMAGRVAGDPVVSGARHVLAAGRPAGASAGQQLAELRADPAYACLRPAAAVDPPASDRGRG
ncbi:hypothetical protein G6F57_014628 [Rhizopus arrhizus]|nr:hypothetical protein G6F31_021925 [Rhizopus arrhizus]KAG1371959.1 hypothetical protein G6F60_015626 [Rhizopus arrhizus]KAG1436313.1 hypothetical protein G6F55_014230 [Rhizopus delemar]KAG1458796.1 hypothetical protein G6F57_014628 [Rhizopus arrhizus]KAG1597278.1 hypothetical protein G6F46_014305 [Rhizopus delemar]